MNEVPKLSAFIFICSVIFFYLIDHPLHSNTKLSLSKSFQPSASSMVTSLSPVPALLSSIQNVNLYQIKMIGDLTFKNAIQLCSSVQVHPHPFMSHINPFPLPWSFCRQWLCTGQSKGRNQGMYAPPQPPPYTHTCSTFSAFSALFLNSSSYLTSMSCFQILLGFPAWISSNTVSSCCHSTSWRVSCLMLLISW